MVYPKGALIFLIGIALMTGAWVLGFGAGEWIPSIIMGGAGSGAFVFGSQYDGSTGL